MGIAGSHYGIPSIIISTHGTERQNSTVKTSLDGEESQNDWLALTCAKL
jgi:hypothetical protein